MFQPLSPVFFTRLPPYAQVQPPPCVPYSGVFGQGAIAGFFTVYGLCVLCAVGAAAFATLTGRRC
jgi:hypothetical protein